MKYNELGSTGIQLSHLSIGGGVFSHLYSGFNEGCCIDVIRNGLNEGINYIDTAPWYGQGSSEKTIGKAIKGIPRENFYIGTKVGRYERDIVKMFDFSAEKTEASIDYSLKLLGLDYVDLIQAHDVTFAPDISVVLNETLPTLRKAVNDGKAKYIGITEYDIDIMKEIILETDVKISSILSYAKLTLIDDRLKKDIGFFKDRGIGIINAAGNAMGLLTNKGAQDWHPASDDIKHICRQASNYCQENGVELARLAQWYTMSYDGVTTNLSGMNNMTQLKQTLDVYYKGLSEHEEKILSDVRDRYFKNITLHWDNIEVPRYKVQLQEAKHIQN